jgi:hypothetical protein
MTVKDHLVFELRAFVERHVVSACPDPDGGVYYAPISWTKDLEAAAGEFAEEILKAAPEDACTYIRETSEEFWV